MHLSSVVQRCENPVAVLFFVLRYLGRINPLFAIKAISATSSHKRETCGNHKGRLLGTGPGERACSAAED